MIRTIARSLIAAAAGVIVSAFSAHAQMGPEPKAVTTDNEVFMVAPAELVAGPTVTKMAVSADGRYIIVARESVKIDVKSLRTAFMPDAPTPKMSREVSAILWDNETHATRNIWAAKGQSDGVDGVSWLPGTDIALVTTRQWVKLQPGGENTPDTQRITLIRVSPDAGIIENLLVNDQIDMDSGILYVSPSAPCALYIRTVLNLNPSDGKPKGYPVVEPIDGNGKLMPPLKLPAGARYAKVIWQRDGKPVLELGFPAPEGQKSQPQYYSLHVPTGRMTLLDKAPEAYTPQQGGGPAADDATPIRLRTTQTVLKDEDASEPVSLLWLESKVKSDRPRALLGTDFQDARIQPKEYGLLYKSQGALWVAPIIRLDKQMMAQARDRARKMVALSNAKQVGLGLIMYASDHDGVLPEADGARDAAFGYLKSDRILEGFVYTYTGTRKLSDIENPAETELGYVEGPGGQAVLYADGHAKWR